MPKHQFARKCLQKIRMEEKIIKQRTGYTHSTESKNNFNEIIARLTHHLPYKQSLHCMLEQL